MPKKGKDNMEVGAGLELLNESDGENSTWLDEELSGCQFADKRLGKRFIALCKRLWNKVGESYPPNNLILYINNLRA